MEVLKAEVILSQDSEMYSSVSTVASLHVVSTPDSSSVTSKHADRWRYSIVTVVDAAA